MLPVLRFFQHRTGSKTIRHTADFDKLECMLHDPCGTPMCLPMDFLKAITRDFSEEQELGRGGYGVVYKGVLRNGRAIAVKKLSQMHLEDAQFQNEITYLIGLKHQNIVQLVGYCAESRWEATQVCGRYVLAEIRKRLLCFEYLSNKSLDRHLSAEFCGLEWHMRYDIIRGICCGLHYLHTECHIIHLDLKPENILLDDNMVPKIADFGMSRLFGEHQSRKITESRGGTLGYMAPEYITNGLISTKSDIFSLGVIIIEIMTGARDYPYSSEESFRHFINNVVGNWMNRLEKTPKYIPLEVYSQQVNTCIMIGLNCVDPDLQKRPAAFDIIQILNTVDVKNRTTSESEITTVSSSCTANISNSEMDFSTILNRASTSPTTNISSALTFSAKGRKISILAFEVANVIVKGISLLKTLSKQSIKHLKEGLRSEAICQLISEDHSQLLVLVEADIREELRQFSKEVARFGDRCKDPGWHCLDKYFFRIQYELKPWKTSTSTEALVSNIQYLIKLVQYTSELYGELLTLDKFKLGYIQSEHGDIGRPKRELNVLISSVKNQRNVVKKLKKRSLWTKTMEHIVEKLVDMVHFMHLEINSAFMKNNGDQSVKPASNLRQTLGPAGLAVHYANAILQINMLVSASPVVVSDKARDALYQALPYCIRSKLRESLPRHKTTVAEVRAEMGRILQWLVPVAESTRFYYKNGAFVRQREMKGTEDVDVDDHEERQIIVSAMLAHGNGRVNKIETLYYADKARTEGYILHLVSALHCLVC